LTSLGRELKKHRKRRTKLSQIELSREAGVSDNVVGLIERGIENPTVVVLHSVSTALGISLADLFIGVDPPRLSRLVENERNS
jgi:transcriptional regulator with XRE-family HTH domain